MAPGKTMASPPSPSPVCPREGTGRLALGTYTLAFSALLAHLARAEGVLASPLIDSAGGPVQTPSLFIVPAASLAWYVMLSAPRLRQLADYDAGRLASVDGLR